MPVDDSNLSAILTKVNTKLDANFAEKRKLIVLREKIESIIQKDNSSRQTIYDEIVIEDAAL